MADTSNGNDQKALRFVTEETLPFALQAGQDLSAGFTLEAWVWLAPTARAARIYGAADYGGEPVVLVEGRYEDLSRFRLTGGLWGVELPSDLEIVLFSELRCVGQAWGLWQDTPALPDAARMARSAIVFDRRHRKQESVVLFAAQGWTGQAVALRLGERRTVDFAVLSAIVPPGVSLRPLDGTQRRVRGDAGLLSGFESGLGWTALRADADPGHRVTLVPSNGQPGLQIEALAVPDMSTWPDGRAAGLSAGIGSVLVPDGWVVHLYSGVNFSGARQVVADDTTSLSLDWEGSVGSIVATTASDDEDGVVTSTSTLQSDESVGRLVDVGSDLTPADIGTAPGEGTIARLGTVIVPPGFRLEKFEPALVEMHGPGLSTVWTKAETRFRVCRPVGVACATNGFGLEIDMVFGALRRRGWVPSFAGQRLREQTWYHLAVSWTGTERVEILDGKEVQRTTVEPRVVTEALSNLSWVLGGDLRGAVARVRLTTLRTVAQVRAGRFDTTPGTPIAKAAWDASEAIGGARWIDVRLPAAPGSTALSTNMMGEVDQAHQAQMQLANARAALTLELTEKRANARLAAARGRASVDVANHAISALYYVFGGQALYSSALAASVDQGNQSVHGEAGLDRGTSTAAPIATTGSSQGLYVTDTALAGDATDGPIYLAVGAPTFKIARATAAIASLVDITPTLAALPWALAVDPTGGGLSGQVVPKVWWIAEGGALWSCVVGADPGHSTSPTPTQEKSGLMPGRPRTWDLCVDARTGKKAPIWSNGWEIWRRVSASQSEVLVPHARSPHPVAVIAHESTLVWVDLEDEVVRSLNLDDGSPVPKDLYPAVRPGRGVAVGLVHQRSGDTLGAVTTEVPMLYWVAAHRAQVECAVIDSPGLFLWLDARSDQLGSLHQHVPALADVHLAGGAGWAPCDTTAGWPLDRAIGQQIQRRLEPGQTLHVEVSVDLDKTPPLGARSALYSVMFPLRDGTRRTLDLSIESGALKFNLNPDTSYALQVVGASKRRVTFALTLQVTSSGISGSDARLEVSGSGEDLERVDGGFDVALPLDLELDLFRAGEGDFGALADLRVWIGEDREDAVVLPPPRPEALHLADATDQVDLGPLRLDLSRGLSVATELVWDGPAAAHAAAAGGRPSPVVTAVLAFASTEQDDVLALVLEADGLPALRLNRGGRSVAGMRRELNPKRALVRKGKRTAVSWALSAAGLLTVSVNGVVAYTEHFQMDDAARLYTCSVVGGPPSHLSLSTRAGLKSAHSPAVLELSAYAGRILRLLAWNTLVESDELLRMASDPSATPAVGASDWSRSLVTDQTLQRFLHVGRLDGSGTPLALFPIDLDGGLALVTRLSAAHTALNEAHAAVVAAEAHAAQLSAAAVASARAEEAAARKALVDAQQKADADLLAANVDAARQRAEAQADRARREAAATAQEAEAQTLANARKATAKATSDQQVIAAGADKQARIASAGARLSDAKALRDAKRQELASKQ